MLYSVIIKAGKEGGKGYDALLKHSDIWRISIYGTEGNEVAYDVHAPKDSEEWLARLPGVLHVLPIRNDVIFDLGMPEEAYSRLVDMPDNEKNKWGILYVKQLEKASKGKIKVQIAFDAIKLHVMAHNIDELIK